MEARAALGAATALALTVTGGVSALFLTMGQASGTSSEPTSADGVVAVEYVDQYGNPVSAPQDLGTGTAPDVVLVNPDGTVVTASTTGVAPADAGQSYQEAPSAEGHNQEEYEYEDGDYEDDEYEGAEYEDGDYEEEEEEGDYEDDEDYEEGDDYEDSDDNEDGDEYAAHQQVGEADNG